MFVRDLSIYIYEGSLSLSVCSEGTEVLLASLALVIPLAARSW